jgi:hypothetical protein
VEKSGKLKKMEKFTLKSGNSTPFKMMGSSPAKQKETIDMSQPAENRVSKKNLINKGKPHNNWGRPGYDSVTGKKDVVKTTSPKNFNTKGSSKAGKFTKVAKIDHVGRTTDLIHKNEMKAADLKKSRATKIKKVKGKTVKISKKDVLSQMKKAGSKLKYSDVEKALKTSIKAAGKTAKFIPGLNLLMNLTSKSATATQPGTGKHGGTKTKTYDPTTGTYR